MLKGCEYQFWTWIWKPQIWNFWNTECFQFSVDSFLSNCWFYYLFLYMPQQRNLEFWTYFSVISFLCSAEKKGFQMQLFKKSGSNPIWFWKLERNPFQTWKRPFLVYFKRATVWHRGDKCGMSKKFPFYLCFHKKIANNGKSFWLQYFLFIIALVSFHFSIVYTEDGRSTSVFLLYGQIRQGQMANFLAFIASKSFHLWNHHIPQMKWHNLRHILMY